MTRKLLIIIILIFFLSGCAAKQSYVSITFDDGYISVFEKAWPILKKHDFPATIFIETSKIETDKRFMKWDQIFLLIKNEKWEIGSHTHTHPDLTIITPYDAEYELNQSKQILISKKLEPIGFASPYGSYNNETIKLIKKYYKYHRIAWGGTLGFNETNKLNVYEISACEISHDMSFEEIKHIIDKAINEKKWLVLLLHRVVEDKATEYEISTVTFQKTVNYLKSKNVKVVTIADFLKTHNLLQ